MGCVNLTSDMGNFRIVQPGPYFEILLGPKLYKWERIELEQNCHASKPVVYFDVLACLKGFHCVAVLLLSVLVF